jgi:hypothetical protein
LLFVGDDWAEDHHDVEVQDEAGRRLGKARLVEGLAGVALLHELIAQHLGEDQADLVAIGIETDRGPWVIALIAAGYRVSRSTRCRSRDIASGRAYLGSRAMPRTLTCWPTWCAPTLTNYVRSPVIAIRPKP